MDPSHLSLSQPQKRLSSLPNNGGIHNTHKIITTHHLHSYTYYINLLYILYTNTSHLPQEGSNRSLPTSGGLMADVPCLDHSLDGCLGYPDDVQKMDHARRTHARSEHARTPFGAHVSPFGAPSAQKRIVTHAMSARTEEPSMASGLHIKSSPPIT